MLRTIFEGNMKASSSSASLFGGWEVTLLVTFVVGA